MVFFLYGAWLAWAVLGFGLLYLGIWQGIFSYADRPWWTSLYLVVVSAIGWWAFREAFTAASAGFAWYQVVVVLGLVGVSRAVYGYVRDGYSSPRALLSGSREEFLELRYPYLYSKVFEVLFQQSLFVCLVGLFVLDGLSSGEVIVGFVVVNTVLHVGQVLRSGWWFGLFYIVSGFLSSFVFPALYLFVGSGHVVAFVVHYAFYIVCGALAWVHAETLQ